MFGRRTNDPAASRRALSAQDAAVPAKPAESRPTPVEPVRAPAKQEAARPRAAAFRGVLRRQDDGLQRADRHHRPDPARQAGGGGGARGDPRHRRRDRCDQERLDVGGRAGGAARGHLQRRPRLWPARAAAGPRRHRRHHGQRRATYLHRGGRQGPADDDALPRQRPADEHLPADRQPGRPPRRRVEPDLRRAPARRQPRQRHRPAAGHRRPGADHPEVQEGQADAGEPGEVRVDHRPRRKTLLGVIGRVRCNVAHLRRHGLGQDDAAQHPDRLHRPDERVITCEDAAELQLQQPHVVRLETRPPNLEGEGEITMRDLVQELPAHASRAHHRRRGARPRGLRPAAGHEHRPRRLDGHAARQQPARGHQPSRIDDHDGRLTACRPRPSAR